MFWTEGGAVELCFVCGGTVECGSAFWRNEKAERVRASLILLT